MFFPTTKYSFSKALFWCWRAIKTVGFQEQQLKISHDYKCKHQPQPSMLVLQISLMPSRMPYGTFLRMLRPWLHRLICVGCSRPVAVIGGYVMKGINWYADSVYFRKHMKYDTYKIDFNSRQQNRQNQHQTYKLSSILFDNRQDIRQNPANNRHETIHFENYVFRAFLNAVRGLPRLEHQ